MKKLTQEQFDHVVEDHRKYLHSVNEDGVQAVFENVDLTDVTIHGVDLSMAVFNNVDMSNLDIYNTKFEDCDFKHCNLEDTRFLEYTRLTKCQVEYCDFNSVQFINTKLGLSHFSFTNLGNAKFVKSDLYKTIFDLCDLSYVKGSSVRLDYTEVNNDGHNDIIELELQ